MPFVLCCGSGLWSDVISSGSDEYFFERSFDAGIYTSRFL